MSKYHSMSSADLVKAESALDYKDPDLWQEIMNRAEEKEPGITEALNAAICGDSPALPDDIFSRACELITADGAQREPRAGH